MIKTDKKRVSSIDDIKNVVDTLNINNIQCVQSSDSTFAEINELIVHLSQDNKHNIKHICLILSPSHNITLAKRKSILSIYNNIDVFDFVPDTHPDAFRENKFDVSRRDTLFIVEDELIDIKEDIKHIDDGLRHSINYFKNKKRLVNVIINSNKNNYIIYNQMR